MKKNLIPLGLFCVVFLAYFLYLVKVVQVNAPLEQNSIAKSVKRAIDQKSVTQMMPEKMEMKAPAMTPPVLEEPIKRYVNYTWLNVRKEPSLSSPVVEKVLRDNELQVMSYPSSSWAYIKTNAGTKGYVASRYLSERPSTEKSSSASSTTITTTTTTPSSIPTPDKVTTFEVATITYHHITDEVGTHPKNLTLPVVNFIAQLDYLIGHGFKTYTFYDLQKMREGRMTPEKGVILTFNDGYDDAYIAAQHMNGKGLKGVFFIVTAKVGTPGYLDWRQIKKMRSWGMEIGSSGVNGANLSQSTDFYVNDELTSSKKTIEAQLGEPIITFAYPGGRYNAVTMKAVETAGYLFARASDNGSRYTDSQLYKIPTLRVFPPAGGNQFRAWLGE
jgi:peptidoglycan/xylan/chitin deacetylase (PgdA/CDA1 family)